MNITWNKNIDNQHQSEIEKYLNPFLWLTPKWCQNIHINLWDSDESEGADITIKVNYEYRNIILHFYSCYFLRSDDDKQMEIIHELCHTFLGIIADYAQNSFDLLCPKNDAEKFNKHLQDELSVRHESATQDLAFAIYNKFQSETK